MHRPFLLMGFKTQIGQAVLMIILPPLAVVSFLFGSNFTSWSSEKQQLLLDQVQSKNCALAYGTAQIVCIQLILCDTYSVTLTPCIMV